MRRGALYHEASAAASRADFVKTLGWAAKELSEATYWLQLIGRSNWIATERLTPLIDEASELLRITKTIIARGRRNAKPTGTD